MSSSRAWEIGVALGALAICLTVLGWDSRPSVVPAGADLRQFSAERALRHLQVFARSPRTIGSPAHAAARAYLAQALSDLGLEVSIQAGISTIPVDKPTAGMVKNILGRLPGTRRRGKTLLLAAHYDSSPFGPGAADDGAGVAAILETLRALQAGDPLENDLVVLLSDGEEMGLLGSRLFVDRFPLDEIGLVLNFEARGRGGPVFLFQTSPGNGQLVSTFEHVVPHPVGNSLADTLYSLIPNDTDFTIFSKAGVPGLNFAFIRGLPYYHTSLDTLENLEPRSLQQMGNYALGLARAFGSEDLARLRAPQDLTYGNWLGGRFVGYPLSWTLWLNLALLIAGCYTWYRYREQLGNAPPWEAMGVIVLALFASTLTVFLATQGWKLVQPGLDWLAWDQPYNARGWMLVFAGVGLTVECLVLSWGGRRYPKLTLALGGVLVCGCPLLVLGIIYPKTHVMTFWPLLGSLGLLCLSLQRRRGLATNLLFALLALGLVLPSSMLPVFAVQVLEVLGLPAAPLVYLPLALQVLLLLPLLATLIVDTRLPLLGTGILFVLGSVLVIAGSGFDEEHPKVDSLFFVQDSDQGEGWWASGDPHPDEWTSRVLGTSPPRGRLTTLLPAIGDSYLHKSTPAPNLAAPEFLSAGLERSEGAAEIEGTLLSERGAPNVFVFLNRADIELLSASVGNPPLLPPRAGSRDPWGFLFVGLPREGLPVHLRLAHLEGPLELRLIDHSWGLPGPGSGVDAPPPRPADLIARPWPYWFQDATLVSRLLTLP